MVRHCGEQKSELKIRNSNLSNLTVIVQIETIYDKLFRFILKKQFILMRFMIRLFVQSQDLNLKDQNIFILYN